MPPGGAPVTPVDKSGNLIGSSTSPSSTSEGGIARATAPTGTDGQYMGATFTTRGALTIASGDNTTAFEGQSDINRIASIGAAPSYRALAVFAAALNRTTSQTVALTADTNGLFTQQGTLPAGTDRSGSATTSSATMAAANAARRGLEIQNIGANNIGVNEFGGTAAIGTAGTYTLTPGSSMRVRTNRLVTIIAATGATAFTATEF